MGRIKRHREVPNLHSSGITSELKGIDQERCIDILATPHCPVSARPGNLRMLNSIILSFFLALKASKSEHTIHILTYQYYVKYNKFARCEISDGLVSILPHPHITSHITHESNRGEMSYFHKTWRRILDPARLWS